VTGLIDAPDLAACLTHRTGYEPPETATAIEEDGIEQCPGVRAFTATRSSFGDDGSMCQPMIDDLIIDCAMRRSIHRPITLTWHID